MRVSYRLLAHCRPCPPGPPPWLRRRHHSKVPGALVLLKAPDLGAIARRLAAAHDRKGGLMQCRLC